MSYKHKGCMIEFDEGRDIWLANVNGEVVENKQFGNLKLAIDRLLKGDFERVEAFFSGRWGDNKYERVYITSYDGHYCWIIDSKKRRQKTNPSNLYEATEKNKAIFEEISVLERKAAVLQKQIDKVSEKLTLIDEDQFRKKTAKAA